MFVFCNEQFEQFVPLQFVQETLHSIPFFLQLHRIELHVPLHPHFVIGETGPILDSRGFSRISPDPLRQKSFFLAKVIL